MFHLSACCCGTLVEPCETCSIECATSSGATTYDPPLALPEYLELDLTLVPGLPDCCGGEWASGCWLLRNASAFVTGGNCDVYYAVDPANPTQRLWAKKGFSYDGTTSELCVEGDSDQPNLISVLVTGTSNGITSAVTGLILDFNVSDFEESYPGLVRGGLMRYDYEAPPGGVNLCDAGLVTLGKDASSALTCSGVTAEDYWPENVTLTVVECNTTLPACLRTPLCIDDTPCFPNIEASNLYADISLGDGNVFRACLGCQADLGWYGSFLFEHSSCGVVSGSVEIECDGTNWQFRITSGATTEEYELTVNTGGFSGFFGGTNSNICTASTSINGLLNACQSPLIACCPEAGCCPPAILFMEFTPDPLTGTPPATFPEDPVILYLSGAEYTGSFSVAQTCEDPGYNYDYTIRFYCDSGSWRVEIKQDGSVIYDVAIPSPTCEPLDLGFTWSGYAPCDANAYDIFVSVTE